MKIMKSSLALLTLSIACQAGASGLENATAITTNTNEKSAASQKRIDKSSEAALALQYEVEQLQQEIRNLEIYRDHLRSLVANQEEEALSFEAQIDEIYDTRQGVVPLMYQMIDGLKAHVEQDMPIRRDARINRVSKLESMMSRADVSDAEKYRRILEAYMIELDYGIKLGSYQGQIEFEGQSLEVSMLYLGRISLIAKSANGARYWSWNQTQETWLLVDSKLNNDLEQAFRLADQQIAPTLLNLPVSLANAEAK
ncbi:DUF3450 domain-containing protein [Vibrio astriarenae]|uniref:DUF3450 domain-containing protein n=1 Tax=Vibrio astriarenae TaxID=1481923 RepID=UPI0037361A9C